MKSQPHPLHVALCCLAIAAERLAWYATLAALVFLLPKTGMSVAEAVRYSGYLVSAAYACPLIGAQIADRIGYRLATLLGALSLTAGYGLLGLFPVPGLALVAIGNGLFKPSLMAMLTGAFLSGSPDRNRACARLYRAINLGSLPSGFLAGFLVAGSTHRLLLLPLLPATAAIVVALGWRQLRGGEWKSEVEALVQEALPVHAEHKTGSLLALGALLLGAVVFWFGYNQSNNSLALWADKYVDRLLLGFTIPAQWFSSLNPLFIILFTPVADWLDEKVENGRVRVPLPEKLVVGMALVIGSFALLYASGPNPLWLVSSYALLSMGELLVSAAAVAAVTSWAPRGMTARYLSGWFLSISAGGYLSGVFGATTDLRSLFGWTAAACAVGCGWFALNRGRFNRQEILVRSAQVAS